MAPSKVSDLEITPVASVIFGRPFAGINEIRVFAGKNRAKPQAHNLEVAIDPTEVVKVYTQLHRRVYNLSVEEPSGYPFLTALVVYFGDVLSAQHSLIYKCHPQRTVARNSNPGQNPSTDIAIILKCRTGDQYISKVLYEYKPSVGNTLSNVDGKHLIELFLQCFYTIRYEKQKEIVGCLTDLINWHYFHFHLKLDGTLEITKYSILYMDLPAKKEDISSHVHMLLEYVNTQP